MIKFFKENIGITLVGLIVTIIILLILAGISIASLTNSGLFENAKLAKNKSDEAHYYGHPTDANCRYTEI